jgi:hypothetical protein
MTIRADHPSGSMKGGRLFPNTLRKILDVLKLFREEVLQWLARISP